MRGRCGGREEVGEWERDREGRLECLRLERNDMSGATEVRSDHKRKSRPTTCLTLKLQVPMANAVMLKQMKSHRTKSFHMRI